MDSIRNFIPLLFTSFLTLSSSASTLQTSLHLGINPKDEKYYGSEVIKCKDGSKFFTRDRLNDGFCDCPDGTDEPGTSACPEGQFYCRNEGSPQQLLFSSRVNDQLCDCCDGSDEYDGSIVCQNVCFKDGNVLKNGEINVSRRTETHGIHVQKIHSVNLEDLVQKLKELKIVFFLEVVFIIMAFRIFYRHVRSRRGWYR